MEAPICFSQHFVNKQNVRSFSNILKTSLLKNKEDGPFLQEIFKETSLVSAVPSHFRQFLNVLRTNLHNVAKDDFKHYFARIVKPENLMPLNKAEIFESCVVALNDIIPQGFFGGNHNHKIFKNIIRLILFSMKRQHFSFSNFVQKWDFHNLPWKSLKEEHSKSILYQTLFWIIKNILSPLICLNFYVTTCKLDADENKLHFFWKSQWQSYFDKKISSMLFVKTLKKYDPYCSSKRIKKSLNHGERLKYKSLKKDIPKLHLVLKPNGDCRPIVRYKLEQSNSEKYKVRDRQNFLRKISGEPKKKFESQFNQLYQQWVSLKKPKLYFIKTDLSNAFGSIIKEKIMKILCARHLEFQKTEKNMSIKQKIAKEYREMVTELRKPLLVRAGNTVFEWTEGLVQGYKYSPALSELYYSYLDELYFSNHLKKAEDSSIKFFIRVVDDYLYITDSLTDAQLFLEALSSYRNVNYAKTIVNFEHESIKLSNEITFLGYSYNTDTLEVSRASTVYAGQMCYKIAFSSALGNLSKFLENRIGQSGIQINSHIFNLVHNTEERIWNHVFTTFCLSANKFCTILAVTCTEQEMKVYMNLYKKRVSVKLSNTILETLMRSKPKDYMFMYCINHFKYLSYKALLLCAKKTPKCNGLVPLINEELAKSNCLFGKWRDHACRIETNGDMRRKAIKAICTRSDLRKIVQNFDTLPKEFQCFNHKLLS